MDEDSGRARPPDAPQNASLSDSLAALCAAHAPIPPAARFPAGTVFGDWRLTAFIGRGGNGEVYCAEHVALGTPAAVKALVREEERAKSRFTREAKFLSSLKSTAFPRFYAYGEANGTPYLAMELLEPGDLPTGDKAIAQFLLKVCDAVAELHALGYVHRDIKPANILWRSGETHFCASATGGPRCRAAAEPVLADLGLAKDITSSPSHPLTQSTAQTTLGGVGTPGYGAPEQLERGEVSFASDIHSLGVLADHCFNSNPPRTWKRIIQRATSSIPAHRYPSVTAFARAIRRRQCAWHVGVACVVTSVAVAVAWIYSPISTERVSQNTEQGQEIHRVGNDVQEMKVENFHAELSKGWSEMIAELCKFCELGVWLREMIQRHKDFWNKNENDHKIKESGMSWIKEHVEPLMRDWKNAKERHAEKIRAWNKQAGELGLPVPTPSEEYQRLREKAEDILEKELADDYKQLQLSASGK